MEQKIADNLAARTGSFTALSVIFSIFLIAVFQIAGGKSQGIDASVFKDVDMSPVVNDLQRLSDLSSQGVTADAPEMLMALSALQQRVGTKAAGGDTVLDTARIQLAIHDVENALRKVLAVAVRPPALEGHDKLALAIENGVASIERLQGLIDGLPEQSPTASFGDTSPLIFSTGLLALLAVIAGGVSLVLLRREVLARQKRDVAEERADFLARHDPMTGLANAKEFEDSILSGVKGKGSVLVLDLENFVQINDRRGRAFGDTVIKEVAWRLSQIAQEIGGQVARLGGSRFGLYVPLEDHHKLDDLCKSVVHNCSRPIVMGAQTLAPTVCLGAVPLGELNIDGATDCDAILRVASFALSESKTKCSGYTVFDSASDFDVTNNLSLIEALPRAIHDKTLEVHLQPRMSLVGEGVLGFEALVRWCHKGVSIPAEQVVALAEETGISVELDHYMLDNAVGVVADWNRRRKTCFPISVNLSSAYFRHEDGVRFVIETLARHEFPADQLTIEVAESVRFERNPDLAKQFSELRAAGCRISIDDFGTGFSSFATIQSLGADEIKIDPGLVSELDENDDAKLIFDAVLRMGRNLHMDIVIEGVEREAQAELLRTMGCQNAQGYHLGEPRPAVDWLADATYGSDPLTDRTATG